MCIYLDGEVMMTADWLKVLAVTFNIRGLYTALVIATMHCFMCDLHSVYNTVDLQEKNI